MRKQRTTMTELELLIRKKTLKDVEIWLNVEYLKIEQELIKLKSKKYNSGGGGGMASVEEKTVRYGAKPKKGSE